MRLCMCEREREGDLLYEEEKMNVKRHKIIINKCSSCSNAMTTLLVPVLQKTKKNNKIKKLDLEK